MFELKQHLPVQLHPFPVGVFDGHDVPLEQQTCSPLRAYKYTISCHHDNGRGGELRRKRSRRTDLVVTCLSKDLHVPVSDHQRAVGGPSLRTHTSQRVHVCVRACMCLC